MARREAGQTQGGEQRVARGGKRGVVRIPTRWHAGAEDRIRTLEARVAALEEEMEALKQVALEEREGDLVVLRTIPKEQAKQEIRELFASGETLYYSDIVERLGLDIALVIDLCKELEAEGEVVTLGDAA